MLMGAPYRPPPISYDFTFAPQTLGGLYGAIDQSNMAAQTYGMGPWSADNSGSDGYDYSKGFSSSPAGLGALMQSAPAAAPQSPPPAQWSNGWLKFLSAITPGQQVPGGGAGQWIRGAVQGATGIPVASWYDWTHKTDGAQK